MHFPGKLSTGIDPAINLIDLVNLLKKYVYVKYNEKMDGGLSWKDTIYQQDVSYGIFKGDWSFLMSLGTQLA